MLRSPRRQQSAYNGIISQRGHAKLLESHYTSFGVQKMPLALADGSDTLSESVLRLFGSLAACGSHLKEKNNR
jgi:hypothetical protein